MGPQIKHTIVDQGWSWTTPLKNCLDVFFLLGSSKAAYILAIWEFVRISSERNKKKYSKRKNTLAKEKVKGMFEKNHSRKQLDTIVEPPSKHIIVEQGCSWTTPLKNCLNDVFSLCFYKASYILENLTFLRISSERN